MKNVTKLILISLVFILISLCAYGEAPLGFGFKKTPKENAELIIARYWFDQIAIEGGFSFWADDMETFNQHVELMVLYQALDLSPAKINLFAGVQLTNKNDLQPEDMPGWVRFGMELEFFLVERVSIIAEGSVNFSMIEPYALGNNSMGMGTGFLVYF